jgi:hypothetical protein
VPKQDDSSHRVTVPASAVGVKRPRARSEFGEPAQDPLGHATSIVYGGVP